MQQSIAGTVNGAAVNLETVTRGLCCASRPASIHRVWKTSNLAAAISAHASTRPRADQQQTEAQ